MKLNWKLGIIIALAAIISIATLGVTYAANGDTTSLCTFGWTFSNDDNSIGKPSAFSDGIDPDDNGRDPLAAQTAGADCVRSASDIATTAVSFTTDAITFNLNNAYPGYSPTIFFGLSNQWATPGIVQSINIQNPNPALLLVSLSGITLNQIITAGETAVGALSIGVGDIPQNLSNNYSLSMTLTVSQWTQAGHSLSINNANLPSAQLSVPYSQTLNSSNGNPPYTWAVTSGSLPPGLTLNPVTGVISGTPAAGGSYNFTVTLSDAGGDTAAVSLSIVVLYPNYPPASGSNSGTIASSGGTPATVPPPTGSTAENPPTGSTAEIPPVSNPVATPQLPVITHTPAPEPTVNPLGQTATSTPNSEAVNTPDQPATSIRWLLIGGIIIIAIVAIFWWIIVISRRKNKKEET